MLQDHCLHSFGLPLTQGINPPLTPKVNRDTTFDTILGLGARCLIKI